MNKPRREMNQPRREASDPAFSEREREGGCFNKSNCLYYLGDMN